MPKIIVFTIKAVLTVVVVVLVDFTSYVQKKHGHFFLYTKSVQSLAYFFIFSIEDPWGPGEPAGRGPAAGPSDPARAAATTYCPRCWGFPVGF
jgi:hypothetical protein